MTGASLHAVSASWVLGDYLFSPLAFKAVLGCLPSHTQALVL